MPTAEGIFPKDVNGADPLYASEVNRFSPKLIGKVSQYGVVNVSGTTAYTTLGTPITYSGTVGSIKISEFMNCQFNAIRNSANAGHTHNVRLRISGTAGLNMTSPLKTHTATSVAIFSFNHVFTSGVITASGGNIGSNYSIFPEANSTEDAATVQFGDFLVWGH